MNTIRILDLVQRNAKSCYQIDIHLRRHSKSVGLNTGQCRVLRLILRIS